MGHNELGELPLTLRWRQIIELLDAPTLDAPTVAARIVDATDARFRRLAEDPGLAECVWILSRVASAAREPDFTAALRNAGVSANDGDGALAIIAKIADQLRDATRHHQGNGQYVEIGAMAVRQALSETVLTEGPGLLSSQAEDVQRAFRAYSTKARFGELARRFFAHFMSRTLQSYVDRELANHVGKGAIANVSESRDYLHALETHASQTSRIVEDFAGGWFSKHNYESAGEISRADAQAFLAVALRKMRTQLRRGNRP